MRNLRYRYFVWLDKKFTKHRSDIPDIKFIPQEEYTLSDQFLLIIMFPFGELFYYGDKIKRFLTIRAKKLGKKLSVVQEEKGERLDLRVHHERPSPEPCSASVANPSNSSFDKKDISGSEGVRDHARQRLDLTDDRTALASSESPTIGKKDIKITEK